MLQKCNYVVEDKINRWQLSSLRNRSFSDIFSWSKGLLEKTVQKNEVPVFGSFWLKILCWIWWFQLFPWKWHFTNEKTVWKRVFTYLRQKFSEKFTSIDCSCFHPMPNSSSIFTHYFNFHNTIVLSEFYHWSL